MFESLKRIIAITGHYGTGKTNFAVNLALTLSAQGKQVAVADMDIVNPYFRSADFVNMLAQRGIESIIPMFANTNLDTPSLTPGIHAALVHPTKTVILDVGGDDSGAAVLGSYAPLLREQGYTMIHVINAYRSLTAKPEDAVQILREVEGMGRLPATAIANNSHLMGETQPQDIVRSAAFAQEVSRQSGLPLLCTCVRRDLAEQVGQDPAVDGMELYPVDVYVKPVWES